MVLYGASGEFLLAPEISLSTMRNQPIPNEQRQQRPPSSMQAAKDLLTQRQTVVNRSLDSQYNCMGMVFASRRTWVDPVHLEMILEDDGYHQIGSAEELQVGDVVLYQDDTGSTSHVGIVSETRTNLNDASRTITVLSQWGADGEYFHEMYDVIESLGKPSQYWTDRK